MRVWGLQCPEVVRKIYGTSLSSAGCLGQQLGLRLWGIQRLLEGSLGLGAGKGFLWGLYRASVPELQRSKA